MILFILLTVFIAGLMVGRTPDYLGKRIEGREITWRMVALLACDHTASWVSPPWRR